MSSLHPYETAIVAGILAEFGAFWIAGSIGVMVLYSLVMSVVRTELAIVEAAAESLREED